MSAWTCNGNWDVGVELVRGHARLDGERRVRVGDDVLVAHDAVVAAVPLSTLAHAIASFPTRSELWLKFLEAHEQRHGHSVHGGRDVALRTGDPR